MATETSLTSQERIVRRLDRLILGLPTQLPCLNPACHKTITYRSEGSGRQARYCSQECRLGAANERKRLLQALEQAATLKPDRQAKLTEQHINATIARLIWHLQQYRPAEKLGEL